eukprot:27081-Pelagomonas_calceolata.AAC.1
MQARSETKASIIVCKREAEQKPLSLYASTKRNKSLQEHMASFSFSEGSAISIAQTILESELMPWNLSLHNSGTENAQTSINASTNMQ